MSSIEIQVQLDFFYKDVVSTYEETGEKATKDKDQTKTASSLHVLFVCLHIVCGVMKEVGESVDVNNGMNRFIYSFLAFSSFDYDQVVALSTAWADTLRNVKEFVTLELAMTQTDM